MYIQDTGQSGKRARSILLRESYWDKATKTVKNRTLANLTAFPDDLIAVIKAALPSRAKGRPAGLAPAAVPAVTLETLTLRQGRSVGALYLLLTLAARLGLVRALGSTFQGLLALWQVFARLLDQGSRLSAVRLAQQHEAAVVLGLKRGFDEDDLYANLDWLTGQQDAIEDRLFTARHLDTPPALFLYDVTSTYLEGTENDLGAFGYNRDKKRGKEQIVMGLLCDAEGCPVSIEAFPGNTQNLATFGSQVTKVKEWFGGAQVIFVGDRGMIKGPQQKALAKAGFTFITALTRAQIRTLIAAGTFQMDLFDEALQEIEAEGKRYVLRRNPVRAGQLAKRRQDKQARLATLAGKETARLKEHPKAKPATGLKRLSALAAKLDVAAWLAIEATGEDGRTLVVTVDPAELEKESVLDGCYALVTDVPKTAVDAQTVHDRYKDLARVEQAFRTSKTGHLEVRPVFVRKGERTRGHILVVMLAYLLRRELARCWAGLDVTVEEGLAELDRVCLHEIVVKGHVVARRVPEPSALGRALLAAAQVTLPASVPINESDIGTRKILPTQRNQLNSQNKTAKQA